jgi:hypothetical protein
MKKLLKIKLGNDEEIFIEANANDTDGDYTKRSKNSEIIEVDENFETLISKVKPVSEILMESLKDLNNPEEIEVSFGLKFGGKAGIVFASVDTEATFNLKIKWKNS